MFCTVSRCRNRDESTTARVLPVAAPLRPRAEKPCRRETARGSKRGYPATGTRLNGRRFQNQTRVAVTGCPRPATVLKLGSGSQQFVKPRHPVGQQEVRA